MYNIPGLTKNLQLTSYTTCAILTGGITNWDDSHIAASNPGSHASQSGHPAGDRERPRRHQLRARGVVHRRTAGALGGVRQLRQPPSPGNPVAISPTSPSRSGRPSPTASSADSTAAVASDVVGNPAASAVCSSSTPRTSDYGQGDPAQGVASEQNASGDYTQPTPVDVASALAYATQLPNGTHQLNFNGVRAARLQPLDLQLPADPTKGWSCSKGTTMSDVRELRADPRADRSRPASSTRASGCRSNGTG